MKKMNYIKIILILTLVYSCSTKKTFQNDDEIGQNSITAIKFMGTVTTHPSSTNEKSFWAFKDEHVILKIRNYNILDEVKSLKNKGNDMMMDVNYSFLIKQNNKITDTLYSDSSLKSWVLKKGKTYTMFSDDEGKIAQNLRQSYSFFNDCW
ncbi:hypothetical protein [Flavobacterium humi]|uniref:Lipoprotein n=1 Tax=Flavobacterium humi TaxID=2562683 RepID=A0A4Z0L5R2_9FLAO|nr:hypothetical protein [Flavobacterium humi]TGD57856.1 hypothetical protein E4635_07530 [Flavobacterium humi]